MERTGCCGTKRYHVTIRFRQHAHRQGSSMSTRAATRRNMDANIRHTRAQNHLPASKLPSPSTRQLFNPPPPPTGGSPLAFLAQPSNRCSHLPFTSMRSSAASASPFVGSVPLSATNFSIRRRSNTAPETGETTGFSGTAPETAAREEVCGSSGRSQYCVGMAVEKVPCPCPPSHFPPRGGTNRIERAFEAWNAVNSAFHDKRTPTPTPAQRQTKHVEKQKHVDIYMHQYRISRLTIKAHA